MEGLTTVILLLCSVIALASATAAVLTCFEGLKVLRSIRKAEEKKQEPEPETPRVPCGVYSIAELKKKRTMINGTNDRS